MDIANNGAGHVGSDGTTFPSDRARKYANVTGVDDFFVVGGKGSVDVVIQLILDGGAAKMTNNYWKKVAVASCPHADRAFGTVTVAYFAEKSSLNSNGKDKIAGLKVKKSPVKAAAEAEIQKLKKDLLNLVRKEREARMAGDQNEQDIIYMQTRAVISEIKNIEASLVQAVVDEENARKAAELRAQEDIERKHRVTIAEQDLAVSVAKLARLTKAKDILISRAGEHMNPVEEKEFSRSVQSFLNLVNNVKDEVAEKQLIVEELMGAPSSVAVLSEEADAFDSFLPNNMGMDMGADMGEVTNDEFDLAVPDMLKPEPLESSKTAMPLPSEDPFTSMLPKALREISNNEASNFDNNSLMADLGDFDLGTGSGSDFSLDLPDMEGDMDFDFGGITAGIPGAAELLGGRRLQADVTDVSTILFGSDNLAL